MPREERHQDAGEAVAGREIGVGAALHGRDLDHAGETRGGAAEQADDQDQLADAEPDHLGGAHIAAGDARREAEHRVVDQDIGEHAATTPKTRPQCTSVPGIVPIMLAAPISRVDGLLRLAGSRIGPSTR